MRVPVLVLAILFGGAACSPDGESPPSIEVPGQPTGPGPTDPSRPTDPSDPTRPRAPVFTSVRIEPARADLVLGAEPIQVRFAVVGQRDDGSEQDVTARARLSLSDPAVLRREGAVVETVGRGGETVLSAEFQGFSAQAPISVRVERSERVGPDLPPDPAAVFAGARLDEQRPAARIVYPLDGTLLPPNLAGVEIHYIPGRGEDRLFRLHFSGPGIELEVFTRCERLGEGCLYALPPALWTALGPTVAGRGPVELRIEATDDGAATRSRSAPLSFSIAPRPVEGGLYYWTTSRQAIMRVDFGRQGAPERYWPTSGTGTCYGCHALSPDGRRMTLSQGGINNGRMTLLRVAEPMDPVMRGSNEVREQFQSWSPDSERFAGVFGDGNPPSTQIRIRSGDTGAVEETIELGFEPSHVDWSPAGDRIAVTQVTIHSSSQRPGRGGIAYVEREAAGWSAPRVVVEPRDGFNHYTPAFSPDGSFLLFGRSQCPPGQSYAPSCNGDTDPSSRLFALLAVGGTPVELTSVNAPGPTDPSENLAQTFPKWAPFIDPAHADGSGRRMWFTFSAIRRYGLRPAVGENQLLWMAAYDPDAIREGRDGSFPPFALPFQDFSTSNHIAQWTRRVVPTDPEEPEPMCKTRGEACASDDECCEGLDCVLFGPSGTCDALF